MTHLCVLQQPARRKTLEPAAESHHNIQDIFSDKSYILYLLFFNDLFLKLFFPFEFFRFKQVIYPIIKIKFGIDGGHFLRNNLEKTGLTSL
jgi:hypothetical protein